MEMKTMNEVIAEELKRLKLKTFDDFKNWFIQNQKRNMEVYFSINQGGRGKKKAHLELGWDKSSYYASDVKKVHIGLLSIPWYGTIGNLSDEIALKCQYLIDHEDAHTHYSVDRDKFVALNKGVEAIVKIIADKEGDKPLLKTKEQVSAYLKKKSYPSYDWFMKKVHFIQNSIEDGRIERKRASLEPGFKILRDYVRSEQVMYDNWFEENYDEDEATPGIIGAIYCNQILSLAVTRMYQPGFKETMAGTKLANDVKASIPFIKAGIKSVNCKGTIAPTVSICEIFAEYIYDMLTANNSEEEQKKMDSENQESEKRSGASEEDISEEDRKNGAGQHNTDPRKEDTSEGDEDEAPCGANDLNDKDDESKSDSSEGSKSGNEEEKAENGNSESNGSEMENDGTEGFENNEGNEESGNSSSDSEESSKKSSKGNDADGSENSDSKESKKQPGNSNSETPCDANTGGGTDANAKESSLSEVMAKMQAAKDAAKGLAPSPKAPKPGQKKECKLENFSPSFEGLKNIPEWFKSMKFREFNRIYDVSEKRPYEVEARGEAFKSRMTDIFEDDVLRMRGLKTGKVDGGKLFKLASNQFDCFEKDEEDVEFEGCIYILQDNSGSMGHGIGSNRYDACVATSIAECGMSEIMPLKIVAFDADGRGCNHEVIKNWDEYFSDTASWSYNILGRTGGGQADGYSICVATEELLSRSEDKKLLIVLSDGAPGDRESVKWAVDDARSKGVEVISIYMDEYLERAKNYEEQGLESNAASYRKYSEEAGKSFKEMYGYGSIVCPNSELEDKLVELLTDFVQGNII